MKAMDSSFTGMWLIGVSSVALFPHIETRPMETQYLYSVGATYSGIDGPWTGSVNIYRKLADGTRGEPICKHRDAPGEFSSEEKALEAAKAFAQQLLDEGFEGEGGL